MNQTPSAPEPKYVWFADFVRRQILAGELKPGERLPSRAEIHQQHQITQPTIERAQAMLEKEGLIVRRGRQGVFVADRPGEVEQSGGMDRRARIMSNMIAVVTPHGREVLPGHHQLGWSDFITQGAISACAEYRKHALIVHPANMSGKELDDLLENPPLGFVFSGLSYRDSIGELQAALRNLTDRSQSVVVLGDEAEFAGFDRVDSDHEAGGYLLTRHLIGQGHNRILPFYPAAAEDGPQWLQRRHAGYLRAMREAGLAPMPVRTYPLFEKERGLDDTVAKFEETVRLRAGYLVDFLGREKRCDAILSISDGDVFAHAAACRLLGYEPNRDVALAGYDNIWRDAVERNFVDIHPAATIDKRNWRLGRDLVHLLMARETGEVEGGAQRWLVEPELQFPGEKFGANLSLSVGQLASSLSGSLRA